MNNDLLLVAFLGFTSGYVLKTILHGLKTFSLTAGFVQKVGYQSLVLLGTSVYNISYLDQLCAKLMEESGNTEDAKKMRLDNAQQFEEWREHIVQEYMENYPSDYKWQLEFDDWKGMMKEMTNIYKEKKV